MEEPPRISADQLKTFLHDHVDKFPEKMVETVNAARGAVDRRQRRKRSSREEWLASAKSGNDDGPNRAKK